MAKRTLQYVHNEKGERTAVIVPIDEWREMSSERETQYLMSTPAMRKRIEAAMKRKGGVPAEEVFKKLGLR